MLTIGASAWFWEVSAWRDDARELLDRASGLGLHRLYISVDIRGGVICHLPQLEKFLGQAQLRGIAVEIVEGDPRMIAGRGLANAVDRAAIIHSGLIERGDRLLAGVQYDIEPYVTGHWRGTVADCARWEEAVTRLVNALAEPVDLVLPYWLFDFAPAAEMLSRLPRVLRSATVMAYRTGEAEIYAIARRWTGWAADFGIPLQLAFELGPGSPAISFRGDLAQATHVTGTALRKLDPVNPPRLAVHGLAWS